MSAKDDLIAINKRYGGEPLNRGNTITDCPCHGREGSPRPTFTYKVSDDESQLYIKCWAGCVLDDLIEAMKFDTVVDDSCRQYTFTSKDLFPLDYSNSIVGDFSAEFDSMNFSPLEVYPYFKRGELVQFSVLYKPTIHKYFAVMDGFNKCVGHLEPMLYNHDAVVSALGAGDKLAHLFENEQDADFGQEIGLVGCGVANLNGGNMPYEDLELFKDKNAVVWIGNDPKSLKRAQTLCFLLTRVNCSVWMVATPFGKTFTAWARGNGGASLAEAIALIEKTPEWLPEAEQVSGLVAAGELPASEYDLGTDAFAADFYAKEYRHLVRYNTTLKCWMFFNGKHWAVDDGGEHMECAKRLSSRVKASMARVSPDLHKPLAKLAAYVQSDPGKKAVISSSRTVDALKMPNDRFDSASTKDLFSCESGIIHLVSGVVKPSSYEFFITRHVPVECDMDTEPKRFLEFMKTLWDNEDVTEFMLNFLGMCMTGQTKWQHFLYWKGVPGAGKSQLQIICKYIFGPFCGTIDAGSLVSTQQRSAGADSDLASCSGKRLVFASEINPQYPLDERIINEITGGESPKVKFMNKDKHVMKTECKLVFTSNYNLKFTAPAGVTRRVLQVRFNKKFWEERGRVEDLGSIIARSEGPQILGYLAKRAQKYLLTPECLNEPRAIRDWSNDYIAMLSYDEARLA